MCKKVLILGNGFDLAHGLPTRYSDFMKFCERASKIYNFSRYTSLDTFIEESYNNSEEDDYIKNILCDAFKYRAFANTDSDYSLHSEVSTPNKELDKLYNLINTNIWYKYFVKILSRKMIMGENWIDFEAEISYIIKTIDEYTRNITSLYGSVYRKFDAEKLESVDKIKIFSDFLESDMTVKEVRSILYNDLKRLIQALEIYLSFVESIPINIKSSEIASDYDYILNFNYTDTYQRIYGNCEEIFHIHGKLNHKPNNMVLGIDEYWIDNDMDRRTNFTIFKKFAQRIQKRIGIENYKWFDEIKRDYDENSEIAKIFIFGHSLDVTDKDILYDYLESAATEVTVFCYNETTEGECIANIIKIIGEKRLLEKINQYPPKLKFVIQQDMSSINKVMEALK